MKNINIHTFAVIACFASTVVTSGIHVRIIDYASYSAK